MVRTHAEEFERLVPRIMRHISPAGEEDPLSQLPLGQLRLLRALSEPKSPCEVGEELGLSPSSVSQMSHRLIEAGLVAKEDDREDRRSKRLMLTDLGRSHIEFRQAMRVQRTADLLQRLPNESRESLLAILRVLACECRCSEPKSVCAQLEKGFDL